MAVFDDTLVWKDKLLLYPHTINWSNNISVYKGVTLEDGVFCGPSMLFTNIYNPRAEMSKMDQVRPTLASTEPPSGPIAPLSAAQPLTASPLSGQEPW